VAYDEVETELRRHPKIRDCVVTDVRIRSGQDMVVAYVEVDGRISPAEVRDFLIGPRLAVHQVPKAVIRVDSLPRTRSGAVDRESLPRPPVEEGQLAGLKVPFGGVWGDWSLGVVMAFVTVVFAFLAFLLTNAFWPGSTDLSIVPQPYAFFFGLLYVFEWLAFGLGVAFLFLGRQRLRRMGRTRGLTTLTHLAIVWLLVSWWPQDNSYRLTAKTDWASQAWLVYVFNVLLMICAGVVVLFAARERLRD
jgi:hypothetical protein